MGINEIRKKVLKSIKSVLSHRDLCNLCNFLEISSSGLKRIIQDRLDIYIRSQPYNTLLLISNKIDEYDRSTKKSSVSPSSNISLSLSANTFLNIYDLKADTLNDSLLLMAPIDLHNEVALINRNEIVILPFTHDNNLQTSVPTEVATGILAQPKSIELPNSLLHVPVQPSPFYCCVICLHPLSLLIPQYMPSVNQNNRIMSKSAIHFFLTNNAQKLIAKNIQINSDKVEYKWQVLLRFIAIDPTLPIPTQEQSLAQIIPPFLSITVNNQNIALWDIIPSNTRIKDGRRHPKPVNITDKLNISNATNNNCYRQNITINYWQIPGIFQYYYVGIYLERKLSVQEILNLFITNKHINTQSTEFTLNLIKSKLNDSQYSNGEDDLVVASVLPIHLTCPVGKGRIEIPLRSLNCQHLQCFDAQTFLSMNERRAVWKCPICDSHATLNELFCDIFFQDILNEFKDNENINDVNVRVDGSYLPVFHHNDDKVQADSNKPKENCSLNIDNVIILDSEEEEEEEEQLEKNKKVHVTNTLSLIHLDKENTPQTNDIWECHSTACEITKSTELKTSQPMESVSDNIYNVVKSHMKIIQSSELLNKSDRRNDASISSHIFTSNYSTLSPMSSDQNIFPTSKSLTQTQIPEILNSSYASLKKVIQTPILDILQTNQVTMTPSIYEKISACFENPEDIGASHILPILSPSFPELNSALNFTPSNNLYSETIKESTVKENVVETTEIMTSSFDSLMKQNLDKSYDMNLIPADKTFPIKSTFTNKVVSSNPIICPLIVSDQYLSEKVPPEIISSSVQNMQNNSPNLNISKKTTLPPVTGIAIPEVTIDLTSDDDECYIYNQTDIPVFESNKKTLFNNNVSGNQESIYLPYTNGRKIMPMVSINANSFNFKPHLSTQRNAGNKMLIQYKRPIDLTGDDEDDVIICPTFKRSRIDFNDDSSDSSVQSLPKRNIDNCKIDYASFRH